jgi:hypothetical protein
MGKTKIMLKQVRKEFTQKENRTWEPCRRKRQTKRLDYYMTHTKSRCLRKRKKNNIQCYVRQALNFKLQSHTQQFLGMYIHRICTTHFVTKENIVQANINTNSNKMQPIYRIFIKSLHFPLLWKSRTGLTWSDFKIVVAWFRLVAVHQHLRET